MTSSQFGLSTEQIGAYAAGIAARLQAQIPAYRRIGGSPIEQDLIRVENRNLELYLSALSQERLPDPAELTDLELASGTRLRQGFPLDAVLRAGRLEAQAMWEIVVAHAPPES